MTEFELIDLSRPEALIVALNGMERIGVDTEFMREKTYFPRLCLVQIVAGDSIWCADPLPAVELGAFWDAVLAPEWVLHSSRQDLEVVQNSADRLPHTVFDTQIAAALLGYQPQMGYASLVAELFGVELAKSHTRADWSRRPLSPEVMEYAAEDVKFLLPAADELRSRLERRGRLDWALQDAADLLDPALYRADPDTAVERVKGAQGLGGPARGAAIRLARWREERAVASDKPRQWILRDTALLAIAASGATTHRALAAIPDVADGTVRRHGDTLLALLQDAREAGESHLPQTRPDEEQRALQKSLQKRVAARAGELGIAAEVLAPRRELSAAIAGQRDLRVFRGWRADQVGSELLAMLD
ncbi:MAG: HRDC domain-containing protein [Woeseiaceae bacterium]|nr:HRDC domain-containing protein [Woeseiaceae bacterium]